MGLRCVLDLLLVEAVGDEGGFAAKVSRATNEGFLSNSSADALSAAIEAGHAASHRSYCPKEEDLNRTIDIVENLTEHLFIVPKAAEALRKTTPVRR